MTDVSHAAREDAVDIRVRRMDLPKDEPLPRWWFFDSALISHRANALNLLFPAGEQFFIRSVRHYTDQIDDPVLLSRIRAFAGQEAQHGRAHQQAFEMLEDQGFEIRSFLAWYEHLAFGVLERIAPPILCLSTTVALEHFTATLATQAFTDGFLDHAHPTMRDLLRWHAAEEIEHKAVAFDVFQAVGGSYPTRLAGLAVATGGLMYFWGVGSRHLLAQEPTVTKAQLKEEYRQARARGQDRRFLREGIVSYLRRAFHPDEIDNRGLARDYLSRIGRLAG